MLVKLPDTWPITLWKPLQEATMMFSSSNAASAYRAIGVQTRAVGNDPHQLVQMVYEAILESVAKAQGAMQAGDVPQKIQHIDKAIRLIQEGLITSLDLDNGGELAANLQALYEYAVLRLTQANAQNDTAVLDEVASLVRPLLEAWTQIRPGAQAAETATSPAPAGAAPASPAPRTVGAYADISAYRSKALSHGA